MKNRSRKRFSINISRIYQFLPLSLCVILMHGKYINEDFIDYFHLTEIKPFIPIYFAVIVSNPTNIANIIDSYYSWGNKVNSFSPKSIYKIYSPLKIKELDNYTRIYNISSSMSIEMSKFNGFINAAKDFLKQNKTDWFFRTTDYSFVNLPMFGKFVNYIDGIYTPSDTIIMKGETKRNEMCNYINGKAGYLMSRRVVEIAVRNANYGVATDEYITEDVMMNELLEDLYTDLNPFSTHSMLGTTLSDKTIWRLMTGEYRNLTYCKEGDAYVRVNDIAVWATDDKKFTALHNGRSIVSNTPKNIFFKKVRGDKAVLCIGNDNDNPLWMDYEPYFG